MHVFLTGQVKVGKTTIIDHFLKQSGLSADGFVTSWEPGPDSHTWLELREYGADNPRYRLACRRDGRPAPVENLRQMFDIHGSAILQKAGCHDVIVMDELGSLEASATLFQAAVLEHLANRVPVLGVIQPRPNPFLDQIRATAGIAVLTVTPENRQQILSWLLEEWLPGSGGWPPRPDSFG